jgi:hypothetical protein
MSRASLDCVTCSDEIFADEGPSPKAWMRYESAIYAALAQFAINGRFYCDKLSKLEFLYNLSGQTRHKPAIEICN